jgi:DNA-binding response OmpR family regulator
VIPTACKVLVLDDDERLLLLLRLVLTEEGLLPFTFSDGQAALDAVASIAPDAIVLDLDMPTMTGREFYKQLRLNGHKMPVLVLSANGARAARRELGAEASMEKPFSSTELARRIGELAAA